MSSLTSGLYRCTRGTATVEAVIALPVLILLFASVFFMRDLSTAKHEAAMKVRSCAWLYSANNCTSIPDGCDGVLDTANTPGDAGSEVSRALEEGKERISGGDSNVISTIIGTLLDPALEAAFGRTATARTTREVPRPVLFGGGQTSVSGQYELACNLQHSVPLDVVKDAWNLVLP